MIAPKDLEHCVEAIRHGSRSFHAASKLLPARVRDPALALYAFCRLADDEVDLQAAKADAVLRLHDRLDRAYSGRPADAPADRAFAAIIEDFEMPRALPEALLEGLAWDAMERRYDDLSGLRAYSARVASAVGAMMCVLMRVRDKDALARACDLGVAMQLTNIARDVGEDAREGRLYLPLDWLGEVGIDPEGFLRAPTMSPDLRIVVRRLLREAQTLYNRSEAGIAALPLDARPGIFAARFIYAGIGREVARTGYNSIDQRARTGQGQKLAWLALSVVRAGATALMPKSAVIHARPVPETDFLIEATARPQKSHDWSDALHASLITLKAREEERRAALMSPMQGLR
ncbi:15-cis-phytoene synthase [Primorskyibacter sp. 2E233]|uniref:15-cis-phytoene synthase n=1 Tax=Primorskyibacter sp. 2E233 TaxID=3413431 RepID=UPI003BEF6AD2